MSILKLATAVALVGLVNISALGQQSKCDSTCTHANSSGRCGMGCGLMFGGSLGLGSGCGNGRDEKCLSADQLWAGFGDNLTCKGCVRADRLRPSIPALGGFPACGRNHCAPACELNVPVPSVSVNWPRPAQIGKISNGTQRRWLDGLNFLGNQTRKNVRCDIANDDFGKLGESKFSFTPLPQSTSENQAANLRHRSSDEENIPPAPIVEPVAENDELPSIENARKLEYGKFDFSR